MNTLWSSPSEEGARRRDHALANHEARRSGRLLRLRIALVKQMLTAKLATGDDAFELAERLGFIQPGEDRRWLGTVFVPLARAGVVVEHGFVRSRRPERRASKHTVWRLTNYSAARRWLADNGGGDPLDKLPPATASMDGGAS